MIKRSFAALIFCLMLFSGCSAAPTKSVTNSYSTAPQAAVPLAPAQPQMDQSAPGESSNGQAAPNTAGGAGSHAAVERIVIKNANLSIIVADPAGVMQKIDNMAVEMKGFVVSSNLVKTTTSSGAEVPQANITIRVPAENLTDAMNRIKGMVADKNSDISSENVTGQDVTKEYTDLKSRLTNLQNTRDQLQKIMDEARKTEDILSVYNQISSINEQIEVLQGQIKYYDESASMSAIAVQIISKSSVQPISVAGWQPVGVARDAVQALLNALQWLGNALIWIVIFCLPIALLAGIPLYFIFQGFRRYRARRKAKTSLSTPAQ